MSDRRMEKGLYSVRNKSTRNSTPLNIALDRNLSEGLKSDYHEKNVSIKLNIIQSYIPYVNKKFVKKLRVLIVSQYFWPEQFRVMIAKFLQQKLEINVN